MVDPYELPSKGLYPFLRWAGSKRQLLPLLTKYWDKRCVRYVEPFAGSACLFFRLMPEKALLGDINADLIETYREVKCRPDSVIALLRKLRPSRRKYLKIREMKPHLLDSTMRAVRFIYLNRFCFNGLYRTNQNGHFNVPYGGEKSGNIPSDKIFRDCSKVLRNAKLIVGDFEKVLREVNTGDFVYMDPPFSVKARRVFIEYNASAFDINDLKRLRQWMEILAEKNIPFLVSYAECEEADFLRKYFHTETATVRRNIAGFTGSRLCSKELLISNFRPANVEGVKKWH